MTIISVTGDAFQPAHRPDQADRIVLPQAIRKIRILTKIFLFGKVTLGLKERWRLVLLGGQVLSQLQAEKVGRTDH